MKSIQIIIVFFLTLAACTQVQKKGTGIDSQEKETVKSDKFYQYSIWWAFVNKVFDGDLKVSDLKKQGDIGLGSFDFLDGEMVMLDGIPYRVRENGEITEGADNDEIVYANATFFDEDKKFETRPAIDYILFKTELDSQLVSSNYFYAFKVHGIFKTIKLGGVPKVEKPFLEGLDVLIPKRPVFNGENITGTMIGFYCPKYIGNINAEGYHFHFISDDHKMGGHVMEFTSDGSLDVKMDEIHSYQFELPANDTFENVKLEKEFQYNK